MDELSVYAGWMDPQEKIGQCRVERARGREVIAFCFEQEWLLNHPNIMLKYVKWDV